MRYSIEARDRIYMKGYGFLSFAKNMVKNLSNKYGQKLLDSAVPKTAKATGGLIGNKIADKITSVLKRSTKELPNDETEENVKRATPMKRYISPEERQQIIYKLRLVL